MKSRESKKKVIVSKWIKHQIKDFSNRGKDIGKRSVNTNRVKNILKFLGTNQKILDIGCNDGTITQVMKEMGNEVIGVDFEEVVEIAKRNHHDIQFISFDASNIFPIDDNSFDVVIATELIEHLIDDELFLNECYRILRPGGRLMLTTPNFTFIRNRIWLLFGRYVDEYTHIHKYTFRNVRKIIKASGFRILMEKGIVYDLGKDMFIKNFFAHFKYSYQNPLWFFLESILPKRLRSNIFIIGVKPSLH